MLPFGLHQPVLKSGIHLDLRSSKLPLLAGASPLYWQDSQ